MLSRNDTIILGQQVDVAKALDLLTMFKDAGKEKIDVRTISKNQPHQKVSGGTENNLTIS